jgi:hypothetical protein
LSGRSAAGGSSGDATIAQFAWIVAALIAKPIDPNLMVKLLRESKSR